MGESHTYHIKDNEYLKSAVRRFIKAIGEDPDREGLRDTPQRVCGMWHEFIQRHDVIEKTFSCADYNEVIIVKDIPMYSFCEHHLLPFFGTAHIGYIPNAEGCIIGLSKIGRIVDLYALRLTIQERLTMEIAKHIETAITPIGVAVVLQARHLCMELRGLHKTGQMTITSVMLGAFRTEASARSEFLSLIKG